MFLCLWSQSRSILSMWLEHLTWPNRHMTPWKTSELLWLLWVSCDSAKHTLTRLGPLLEIPTVPAGDTVYMNPTWRTHSFMTVHGLCLFYWSCTWITFSLLTGTLYALVRSQAAKLKLIIIGSQTQVTQWPKGRGVPIAVLLTLLCSAEGSWAGWLPTEVGNMRPSGNKVLNHHSWLVCKHIVLMPLIKEQLPPIRSLMSFSFGLSTSFKFAISPTAIVVSSFFFCSLSCFSPVMSHQSAILSL